MQKVLKAPLSQPLGLQKSDQKALRLKELGNGYFKSKDDSKALNCYTQVAYRGLQQRTLIAALCFHTGRLSR